MAVRSYPRAARATRLTKRPLSTRGGRSVLRLGDRPLSPLMEISIVDRALGHGRSPSVPGFQARTIRAA